MTHKPGRNDACPCGSGKKFKHCHLGNERDLAGYEGAEAFAPAGPPPPDMRIVAAVSGVALIAAVVVGITQGISAGIVVAVACALFIGGWLVLRNPPKADPGSGDPGGINFGG